MDWSFLKEPSLWSVVIASIALILSQLPPIRELLRGTEVAISIPEQIAISHFLGNVQLLFLIHIENIGARRVSIAKVECLLSDAQGKVSLYPAQTYISRQPSGQSGGPSAEYLINRIPLKPLDSWSEMVRCYRLWTEEEEEKVSHVIQDIASNIQSKLPSDTVVEADEYLVAQAVAFFQKNFDLHKGNYKLFVAALSESDALLVTRAFEFTLFESHIHTLRSHAEQYKYGGGINYAVTGQMTNAWVRVRPLSDGKQARRLYEKLRPKSII